MPNKIKCPAGCGEMAVEYHDHYMDTDFIEVICYHCGYDSKVDTL